MAVVKIDNINALLVSEFQFELIEVYAVFTFIEYEKGKLTQVKNRKITEKSIDR